MKKYFLLLIFVFLVSCSEDEDKNNDDNYNGTYIFVSEEEDIQVNDYNGEVSDQSLWDSSLVESKLEFDNDETYNYLEFSINNNFLYISSSSEVDTIPILIENNQIFSNIAELGLKIKIFDILGNGNLQNSAAMYFYKDENTTYSESTNFSYAEYDSQFEEAKLLLTEFTIIALIKQKRTYEKAK